MSKFNNFKNYNPDILETIANLSNDEVFTPPKLANEILNLLPEEVWSNPNLTFLDPAVKTGIFLREITSRLIDGLADQIPDLQERVNHILTKQVFGIGITELTTLMARRTVYCSTTANGEFSICTEFDDEKGNIIFPDTEHTWDKNGRCEFCGANRSSYGGGGNRENYAYPFIHDNFKKEFGNMKFDVIIGNPPYQLSVGNTGANASYAPAIYHLFVDKAIELNPKYITMIIPSKWMTDSAEGIPKSWINKMLTSEKIEKVHDFEDSNEIFRDVGIAGGVNYFLWNNDKNKYECEYTYKSDGKVRKRLIKMNEFDGNFIIRNPIAHGIFHKVNKHSENYYKDKKNNFQNFVATYGLGGDLSTSWRGYSKSRNKDNNIKYYVSKTTNGVSHGWVSEKNIGRNLHVINKHKIFIPRIYGGGSGDKKILGKAIYGEPNSVASSTYAIIGADNNLTKESAMNVISYIESKFFRFMVKILKTTPSATQRVYQLVPLQDFSKSWTDEELYKKYKLTQEEIDYIEENIDEMK